MTHAAVDFFDRQFRRQAAEAAYTLNPFERVALPRLAGNVLDLGCGLGNLSLAAASAGCHVVAVDGSPTAIADLQRRAQAAGLPVEAHCAELAAYRPAGSHDAVVCIGVLMFFACDQAMELLARWQAAVRPGGRMVVNVLVEGTTFMDMFDPLEHCLFRPAPLDAAFRGWAVEYDAYDRFDAPHGTTKVFRTLIARR